MDNVNRKAWLGLVSVTIVMGLILFLAAGTVWYWQAWGYLSVSFVASTLTTLYLMKKDPALLERRLRGGPAAEKERAQKVIMSFTSIGFIALLVVPGLDHRLTWSSVPVWVVIASYIVTVLGYYVIFRVYKENSFASATIEIAEGQTVISTGPYALVRHPMYAGGLLYFLATPPSLGSYWGLLVFAATLPFLIWRLLDEERFLSKNLPGYADYCVKVRWRLIPGVF